MIGWTVLLREHCCETKIAILYVVDGCHKVVDIVLILHTLYCKYFSTHLKFKPQYFLFNPFKGILSVTQNKQNRHNRKVNILVS